MQRANPFGTFVRLLLALAAMWIGIAPALAEPWLKATTDDFVIYSEGDPADLRQYAQDLERFDALLRQRFGIAPDEGANPLTVYLLDKPKSVSRLLDRDHTAGFYSPASEGSFAIATRAADRGGKALSGQMTLFHEYVHHFMYRHLGAPWPAWYREGLAEYLSTVRFTSDGNWTAGTPPGRRLRRARESRVPTAAFLATDAPATDAKTPRDFYAQAWLMVHLLESDQALKSRLDAYLAAIADGEPPAAAAARLGDPAELDRLLEAHAAKLPPAITSQLPLQSAPIPQVAALDETTSALVELELARRTGRDSTATRDALALLAQRFPNDASVLYQLALAERAAGRSADATTDRLLALAPGHARGHVLKAELLVAAGSDRTPILAELAQAASLAPDDPFVLVSRYRIESQLVMPLTPEVARGVARAFALAPESSAIRLSQAFALASRGQFDDAEALVRVMAYDPHAGPVGAKAMEALAAMRAQVAEPPD